MQSFKPIRWKEGLFLRPHHFQQLELYLESREFARLRSLESHSWGLIGLEINNEALDNYTLDVKELSAVLPDGSLVDVPGNARLPISSFERFMPDSGRPLEVYVGIRAREERRPQVVEAGGGQGVSRFSPVERDVFDLDAGEGRAPLEFLEYDLRFFFGDESQQGYDTLPLTQLVGTGDRAHPVEVERSFAPPCLTLRGSPALMDCVRKVQDRLGVVQRELGSQRHSLDADKLVIYQAVSGAAPVLKDMTNDGMVHPRRVYHELSRLAGALLAAAGRSAEEVLPYDHRQPGPIFEHLRKLIHELTPGVIEKTYLQYALSRSEDQFALDLPDEARASGSRYFLEVLADQSTSIVPNKMMSARISSASQIPTLDRLFLPGLPTELLPGPPPELGRDARGTYFRLKHEHEQWTKHILAEGNLTVLIREAPQDISLSLIVVPPRG